ncbi:hypothetical protein CPAST_c35930 [Clostridium pasteurianum DSM 525 = ATCC 6013]|uniref:Uncharacterized protein n=1 Tax=Clostridium pasteurianum DSM 525 = ATCC 6013 TaxID=1262449 RepID=A0A0H3J878_CLOPA|nr:hypothetical protein [Clostridium pasteurianum]AJA49649.1 hypothetical protein CPAST_c35930 [Clostridium pasteurianum DSM 525 = ATCC 6013]AJA53637.1 hypothetical protein CLPA_c35930 [Clostridium pasteurianum DSM 525 = ATCC 6013]AOZ76801.1 hypothetical protein AQ983_17460 [Clostridium pasteurianum DSM 525 = ATCC 6013]AOZ80598.1 hypothetical protein AQ984_17455 [Clostridium pasteurianum]ELP58835.1 hypothetical protein F502_11941 [Clostridium pasteurianum DSM 525 = ATCC 6013]
MDFVGKSFSTILWLFAIAAVVLIGGYLLIHLIPVIVVAGVVIFAAIKGKRYLKEHFKTNKTKINKNSSDNYNTSKDFTYDDLEGEIVDVDYKDI